MPKYLKVKDLPLLCCQYHGYWWLLWISTPLTEIGLDHHIELMGLYPVQSAEVFLKNFVVLVIHLAIFVFNWLCICIWDHSSPLKWLRYSKSFLGEDMDLFIVHRQIATEDLETGAKISAAMVLMSFARRKSSHCTSYSWLHGCWQI